MSIGTGSGVHVAQKRAGGGVTAASNLLTLDGTTVKLGGSQNEETSLGLAAGLGPFYIAGALGEILYYEDDNLGNINWFYGLGDNSGAIITGWRFGNVNTSQIAGSIGTKDFFEARLTGPGNNPYIRIYGIDYGTEIEISDVDGSVSIKGNFTGSQLAYFGPNNPGIDDTIRVGIGDLSGSANGTAFNILDDDQEFEFKGIQTDNSGNIAVFAGTNGEYLYKSGLQVAAGLFTPTATAGTNIVSVTPEQFQFLRIGDTVTVSGYADIEVTAPGDADFLLTIPTGIAFTDNIEAAGSAIQATGTGVGPVRSNTGTTQIEILLKNADTGNLSIHYTYTIPPP